MGKRFQLECVVSPALQGDKVRLPRSLLDALHEDITRHEEGPLFVQLSNTFREMPAVYGSMFSFSVEENKYQY